MGKKMYTMYRQVEIPKARETVYTGWLPPLPDLRDYTLDHPEIVGMTEKLGYTPEVAKMAQKLGERPFKEGDQFFTGNPIPSDVDLRPYCSPVENQGSLGSCTAQAAVGVIEYYENRAHKKHIDGSRLFVYKATRNLMGVTGDTGAWLRNTMGALVLCGCAPEKYWPYSDEPDEFDIEPSPFVYAVADNYEALRYFCHDPQARNISSSRVLFSVKLGVAMGIPSMFGFYGFERGHWEGNDYISPYNRGEIYYPCPSDRAQWGHAIVAVGYDDSKTIENPGCGRTSKGALLIRNSWGSGWGDNGYGWLPYDYVLYKLALDFWSLLDMEWVKTENFGF